jgi:hypothetical protein
MKIWKYFFQRKPKPFLTENGYRVIPAFEWRGTAYYMHEDPMNLVAGRGLTAMMFMEELLMRCSADYLKWHVEAIEKVLSDPKTINLTTLVKLNNNLKERTSLLQALPQHVFKLASIVYFTKEESPYRYDQVYNAKKIKAWEAEEGAYDFFCQGPLSTLMPYLQLPEGSSEKYSQVVKKIQEIHMKDLREVLSRNLSTSNS